ncbi:MAG: hypothetical protein AB2L12_02385 [Smithellaceae bacterium]
MTENKQDDIGKKEAQNTVWKNPALKGKGKSPAEMAQIRALRRLLVKENSIYFE